MPLTSFTTKAEAVSYLEMQCKLFTLCQKYCNLYQTKSACFDYQIKQCFGACVEKEEPHVYNQRVSLLIEKLQFEHTNFFILENGVQRSEKMVVMIENGSFRGYGKIPYYALNKSKSAWTRFIDQYPEDKDSKTIIKNYLRTKPDANIIVF